MEKLLQPERFNVDSNAPNSAKAWTHWHKTFENYLGSLTDLNELKLFTNFISPDIYDYITDCTTFDQDKHSRISTLNQRMKYLHAMY